MLVQFSSVDQSLRQFFFCCPQGWCEGELGMEKRKVIYCILPLSVSTLYPFPAILCLHSPHLLTERSAGHIGAVCRTEGHSFNASRPNMGVEGVKEDLFPFILLHSCIRTSHKLIADNDYFLTFTFLIIYFNGN